MCYTSRKVYTVCAHSEVENRWCGAQKARRERWRFLDTPGLCVGSDLRCCHQSDETTEAIYGFCYECRDFYRGLNTRDVNTILNYWAAKNRHGYSTKVSATLISADEIFGRPSPALEEVSRARCELVALGRELPCRDLESPVDWLQRLERIRQSTLDWAQQRPSTQMHRWKAFDGNVLCVQPQRTPRMSAYQYLQGFSPQQVNISTLYKLCGEIPPEFAVRQDDSVAHFPRRTVQAAPLAWTNDMERPNRAGNSERPKSTGMDHHSDIDTPSYVSAPLAHPLAKIPDCRNLGDPANFRSHQPRVQTSPYTNNGEDKSQSLYNNSLADVIDIYLTEWEEFSSEEARASEGGHSNLSTTGLIGRPSRDQEDQWQRATLTGKVRKRPSPPSVPASRFSLGSSLADPAEDQDPEEPRNYHRNCGHHPEESNMMTTASCFPISDIGSDAGEDCHATPQAPPTSHFSLSDMSNIGLDADEEDEERNATVWRLSDSLAPTDGYDDDDDDVSFGSSRGRDDDDVLRLPEPLPGSTRPASPWRYSSSEVSMISLRVAGGNVLPETLEDGGWI